MPIYQYKCSDCDHQFDALQKMSDAKLIDCPECHLPSLRKQLTAAAFKLNGTGWYETDFKNSGAKPKSDAKNQSNDAKDASGGKEKSGSVGSAVSANTESSSSSAKSADNAA